MLNSSVSRAFFSLLRAGLWNREVDALCCFPLSHEQWDWLYQISINQTVEAIVYDGVMKLPEEMLPSKDQIVRWLVRVGKIEQHYTLMNINIAEQSLIFEEAGLRPILLKGQGLAQYYINPSRRVSGDIDWFLPPRNEYQIAIGIMKDLGVQLVPTAGRSVIYFFKGIETDLHQKIYDIHNPFVKGYLHNLKLTEEQKRYKLMISDSWVNLLSPLEQSLQVNMHILKHLLSFGVGIRQLCDTARLYSFYRDQLDGSKLESIYKRLGVYKWVRQLHSVLINYIGLPEGQLVFGVEKLCSADWMMQDIWQAGNFGFYDHRYYGVGKKLFKHREGTGKRIWHNFKKYFPHAPMETFFFPLVHLYTKITK